MTIKEFLRADTGPVTVKREDGEIVLVARSLLRHVELDRVEILVPGHNGFGRIITPTEHN